MRIFDISLKTRDKSNVKKVAPGQDVKSSYGGDDAREIGLISKLRDSARNEGLHHILCGAA